MGELLSKVIPLSLGAAVSPTVLIVMLLVLSGRRAIARGAAFLVGVLVVLGGLTALGLLISHASHESTIQVEITHAIDVAAGVLLLLLALATVLKAVAAGRAGAVTVPADSDAEPDPERTAGILSAFLIGMAMMASNFSTILLYLPAMRTISASTVATGDKVIAVIIAFVITSVPATVPFGLRVGLPTASAKLLERMRAFTQRHAKEIGVAVELIFGVYLVLKGVR